MVARPIRRLVAATTSLSVGMVALVAPMAQASPSDNGAKPPTGPSAAKKTPASSEQVSVVVMMKQQVGAPSVVAEKNNLAQQNALLSQWKTKYNLTLHRQFGFLVNGFSASIAEDQIDALAMEPGVSSVRRETLYAKTEHTARQLEGVPAAFKAKGVDGSGMVVAIVDTGIDVDHQDMRLDDGKCAAAKITTIQKTGHFTCKVPAGYNYADSNFTVKDTVSAEPHGMHVAGIVGANGSIGPDAGEVEKTGRIDGVAPNAQLLAMKVFPNTAYSYAKDSDIIAAIEDSVKLKADVINMSLGSPNGVRDGSDGTSRAIEKARQAGVMTVISAGNAGQNFSPSQANNDAVGRLDDGTVGTPAVQGSALTVASIDNTAATSEVAYYNDGTDHNIGYSHQSGTVDDAAHPIVSMGLGRTSDYPEGTDLTGKYVLVKRGEISFTEKFQNAIAHKAAGVVVYNRDGDESILSMAGMDAVKIPGFFLKNSDGKAVADAIATGKPVTIRFSHDLRVDPLATGLQPSSFTSWGADPSLDFEPEIAGIGGSVFSTLNNNTYGTMSGTSMAAPNLSGLTALVLENLAKQYPSITGPARLDMAKALLMNTAQIPATAQGVPYAPRQIGAGLARVDKALSTSVVATVDGQPSAALHQVNGSTPFTVTLTNHGSTAVEYQVPAQQVINESEDDNGTTITEVSSETLASSASQVTVPANGTATVTFTLNPASGDHFVEGWAKFTSKTTGQSDLAVPYLGFAGDWNAENIVTRPGDKPVDGLDLTSMFMTSFAGTTVALPGVDELYISPNGDGDFDKVIPGLFMLRNASEVRYQVLDGNGKVLAELGETQQVRRETLSDLVTAAGEKKQTSKLFKGNAFDGELWNAQKAAFEPLADGHYTYRVQARLSKDFAWQNTDMKFGVDMTKPVITFEKVEGTTVTLRVTENGSGLAEAPSLVTPDGKSIDTQKTADPAVFTATIPSGGDYLTAVVSDQASNLGVSSKVFTPGQVVIPDAAGLNAAGNAVGPQTLGVVQDHLIVEGFVAGDIAKVTVAGTPVTIANGRFQGLAPLKPGANTIEVLGFDAQGKQVDKDVLTPYYDKVPPKLEVNYAKDAKGAAVITEGAIAVSGKVSDERPGATLAAAVNGQKVTVAKDGSFSASVTPKAGQASFTVVGSDGPNTTTQTVQVAGVTPAASTSIEFSNLTCQLLQGVCFVDFDSKDVSADHKSFTLKGKVPAGSTQVVFEPRATVNDKGEYVRATPITGTVTADGSFTAALPMVTGENHFEMRVTGPDGKVMAMGLSFYFDVTPATIAFDNPMLMGGTLYANTDTVKFAGHAEDDGWGYQLALNNDVTTQVFYDSGLGPESNRRTFSKDVAVADGDTILVRLSDANGNTMVGAIPVVIDKVDPKVAISGVSESQTITDGRQLVSTATDAHLAGLTVRLNGKVVDQQQTTLATEPVKVEDTMINAMELAADEGTEAAGRTGAARSSTNDKGSSASTASKDAAGAGSSKVTTFGTRAVNTATKLESRLDTSKLAAGQYTMTAESIDLAGNRAATSVSFTVDAAAKIEGPNMASIKVYRDQLGTPAADVTKQILDQYKIVDDGSATAKGDTTLSLTPGTRLVEGKNTVTLVATDASGRTVSRTITVQVGLLPVTLTDNSVSATGTFRRDDALTATITDHGNVRTVVISNRPEFAAQTATISIPGAKGMTVRQVLPDGTVTTIKATWSNGKYTFTGSSKATYELVAPAGDVPNPPAPNPPAPDKPRPLPSTGNPVAGGARDAASAGLAPAGLAPGGLALGGLAMAGLLSGAVVLVIGRRRA